MNTNSGWKTLSKEEKDQRMQAMVELRRAGRPLGEIAAAGGVCRGWACKMMKAAGVPAPKTIVDKNGTRRTKHGMRHTSEYSTWISMRTRCCDPKHPTYERYGGRGITLDPRWLDFHVFLADMGLKPSKLYTLERVDNDKGYCRENCIWLLRRLQNRNQSTTKLTADKAKAIRAIYARGGTTYRKLASAFGVGEGAIAAIITGRTWKEVTA